MLLGKVAPFGALLALAACSGGSGGGGYGGAGGAGGVGGAPLVPTPCEPGDLDVASLAAGPGAQVVQPGPVLMDIPVVVAGSHGFESGPLPICVPEDTVSLIWLPGGEAITTSYVAGGRELIDASSPEQLIRWVSPEFSLPKSPELPLVAGRHTLKLGDTASAQIFPTLAVRRGAKSSSSRTALNLIIVEGSGVTSTDVPAIEQGASLFDQVYAQAGLAVDQLGAGNIADTSLSVIGSADEPRLSTAAITPNPDYPLVAGAANLYFVRELLSDDSAGTLLGHAMGIPGAPGVAGKNGVVVSIDAHRVGGVLDGNALWVTIAHELGHWHGLRHTSERFGMIHDLVGDTPECGLARDLDKNGLVDQFECAPAGANNLMFWIYDFSAPPTVLTPGQAFVLSSALTVRPG